MGVHTHVRGWVYTFLTDTVGHSIQCVMTRLGQLAPQTFVISLHGRTLILSASYFDFFLLAVLPFELRASHLLDKCSTI
jgi:hypothetical protein